MPSAFANRFNNTGRPQLFAVHGEDVTVIDNTMRSTETKTVIWKRVKPDSDQMEGLGIDQFDAMAEAIIHIDDLPHPHGDLLIERAGEQWRIRLAELQDEWTWKLHLDQPKAEQSLPERLR